MIDQMYGLAFPGRQSFNHKKIHHLLKKLHIQYGKYGKMLAFILLRAILDLQIRISLILRRCRHDSHRLFHSKHTNNSLDPIAFTGSFVQLLNHEQRLVDQLLDHPLRVFKTSRAGHVIHGILLDSILRGLLLEDVDQLEVLLVRSDAVDHGKGEFPFREVFAKAFVEGVVRAPEVHVVVPYLEDLADYVDEGHKVPAVVRKGLMRYMDGRFTLRMRFRPPSA